MYKEREVKRMHVAVGANHPKKRKNPTTPTIQRETSSIVGNKKNEVVQKLWMREERKKEQLDYNEKENEPQNKPNKTNTNQNETKN